jgi:hypothetical protein
MPFQLLIYKYSSILSSLADLTTTLNAPALTRSLSHAGDCRFSGKSEDTRWSSFHELVASSATCNPHFRALWCVAMFCANIIILGILIVLPSTSPHMQAATSCYQLIHQCCASHNTQVSLTAQPYVAQLINFGVKSSSSHSDVLSMEP